MLTVTDNKINKIIVRNRQRSGLVNVVGSHKGLSGSLDADNDEKNEITKLPIFKIRNPQNLK